MNNAVNWRKKAGGCAVWVVSSLANRSYRGAKGLPRAHPAPAYYIAEGLEPRFILSAVPFEVSSDFASDAPGASVFPFSTASTSMSTLNVNASNIDTGMTATITLQAKDDIGNNLTSGGNGVVFYLASTGTSGGMISAVHDNQDGTYTATLTAVTAGTARTIAAKIDGAPLTSTLPMVTVNPWASIISIERSSPPGPAVIASSVSYTVTFSQTVTGVDSSDFAVVTAGSVKYTNLAVASVSGSAYSVTLSGISGAGTLGLNLVQGGSIRDLAGQPLQADFSTPPPFVSLPQIRVPSIATTMSVADVNGDGIPDIIAAGTTKIASVLLGNGDGSFQSPQTVAIGGSTSSIAVADVNGDGNADLIVANNYSNTVSVSVLLGNGNGTFASSSTFATGTMPASVVVADVNGDGAPDLIVANRAGSNVSILLGNGDGTFQPQQTIATPTSPTQVLAADMNADGTPDLIISTPASVEVMLGNGDGSFTAPFVVDQGNLPFQSLAVSDVNGDGNLDIVSLVRAGGELGYSGVALLLGNGDGTFTAGATFATDIFSSAIAVADLNQDGSPDVAVTANANIVTVQPLSAPPYGLLGSGFSMWSIAAADLNGDHRPDLITGNSFSISVLMRSDAVSLIGPTYTIIGPPDAVVFMQQPTSGMAGAGIGTVSIAVKDSFGTTVPDDDSSVTLTLGNGAFAGGGNLVTVAAVNGVATFSNLVMDTAGSYTLSATDGSLIGITSAPFTVIPAAIPASQPVLTISSSNLDVGQTTLITLDAGNDAFGNPETGLGAALWLTAPGTSGGTIAVIEDHHDGSYTALFTAVNAGSARNIAARFNGDVVPSTQPTVTVHPLPVVLSIGRSSPAGQTATGSSVTYSVIFSKNVTGVDPTDFTVATTDLLTYGNIAVTSVSGSVYSVAISGIAGSGTIGLNLTDNGSIHDSLGGPLQPLGPMAAQFPAQKTFGVGIEPVSIATADFNRDSNLDIVTANLTDATISVLLGNGNGTFQSQKTYAVGANVQFVAVADVNNDGIPDIVTANYGAGTVSVLLGNGDGTFASQRVLPAGSNPVALAIADVNGDTKPDIVVADYGNGSYDTILLGNGDGTFKAPTTIATGPASSSVCVADLNNDGKPDIVTTNFADGSVSISLGNGDGTFWSQLTLAGSYGADAETVVDLNGDGNLDLVVTQLGRNPGMMRVYVGNGDGTFQAPQVHPGGADPETVAAVDLNGDGVVDLAVADHFSNDIGIWAGNGDGSFQTHQSIALGGSTNTVALADLNHDGRPDLLTAWEGTPGSFASVWINAGRENVVGPIYQFNGAPKVSLSPVSKTATAGANVSFTAAAHGTPTPTVIWQYSGNGGVTWTSIAGATSTTLSFTAAASQNGYLYRAAFTNIVGSATTASARLTVQFAPAVSANPASKTVAAGKAVSFTAAANANPAATVQWQISINGGKTWTGIVGAIAATYTFTTSASQNGNQYRAVFTNAVGQTASLAATLSVQFSPQTKTNPASETVVAGSIATFSAAANANPAATVQWQVSANSGSTWKNITGATNATYRFTPASSQNGYRYRAVFTNSLGAAVTASATLVVQTPPVVTLNPRSQTVAPGKTATFTAGASGFPQPKVQWQISTDGGAKWINIGGASSTTYTFVVSQNVNGDRYRAVFSNPAGVATTLAAILTA